MTRNTKSETPKPSELLSSKRLLIFDFDGTVADTTPLHAAAFSQVLAPLGISLDYSRIAGLKTLDAMRQCLDDEGRTVDEPTLATLVSAKQQCVRKMIGQALLPLEGVDAFLQWARPRYHLAMVTSGSRETVQLALKKLGYLDFFAPVICADDVKYAKPDPEGFLMALTSTGVAASDALVFEDSAAGFEAAVRAGLDYVDVRCNTWSTMRGNSL